MAVVTEAQYRARTGDVDTSTVTVEARLVEAQQLVEEALDRWLEEAERTEQLRVWPVTDPAYLSWTWAGRAYPKAWPVTVAAGDVVIETTRVLRVGPAYPDMLVEPWTGSQVRTSVTYTGGYTDETLPISLRYAIADLAAAMQVVSPVGGAFAGADQVSLGDASISFGDRSSSTSPGMAEVDALIPGMGNRLRPWRRREAM